MRVKNQTLTLSGTDLTSNITSNAVWLDHVANFSVQVFFSGVAVTGTFKLQGSIEEGAKTDNVAAAVVTKWTDLTGSEEAVTESGDIMWNGQNIGFRWVRLVWTDVGTTSGTIDFSVAQTKGV